MKPMSMRTVPRPRRHAKFEYIVNVDGQFRVGAFCPSAHKAVHHVNVCKEVVMNAMSMWCTWYNNPNSLRTTLLFIGCGKQTGHLHIHDVSFFTILVQEDVP